MICSLNETQISDLYKITYKKLSGLKPSESFDLEGFIKDIYNRIEKAAGEEKALQYAQIIPTIVDVCKSNRDDINDKLVDSEFNFTSLSKTRRDFKDLDNVKKFFTNAVRKKSKKELQGELEHENFQLDNIDVVDPEPSELEKLRKAKIEFPNVTTFQYGAKNDPSKPETQKEEDVVTEDKKVFEKVIKKIIKSFNEKTADQNNPIIDGTEVFLKMMPADQLEDKHKLADDKTEQAKSFKGVVSVVTDAEGNYLYFDEAGNITDESRGTVVYQYIRRPYLLEDDLNQKKPAFFTITKSRSSLGVRIFKNTLVAAAKVAERLGLPSNIVLQQQKETMNGVYNMRKDIIDNGNSYVTQITGGSFGIVSSTRSKRINKDLQDTVKLTRENIIESKIVSSKGKNTGFFQFFTKINTEIFGELEIPINIQRGNFDQTLANKVADVITTKATNMGDTLSDSERIAYFELFLNNDKKKSKNNIFLKQTPGGPLTLTINNEVIQDEAIFTTETRDKIAEHLLKAIKYGTEKTGPANVTINNTAKTKQTYTDYEISGNTIKPFEADYIDFQLKYVKPQFTEEIAGAVAGFNPYLGYSIPDKFTEDPINFFDVATDSETLPAVRKKPTVEQNEVAKEAEKEKAEVVQKKRNSEKKETVDEIQQTFTHNWLNDLNVTVKGEQKTIISKDEADGFNRSKQLDNFIDKLFTTKEDKANAEAWWANSPLSKHISLNRISEIVNSDAFATFTGTGITLYEADGGTAVDLYHEAWHGFSQLFLTEEEKIKLYNDVKSYPKWANKSFFDIEEDIAEDFRDYARSKGKKAAPKGFLGNVFQRIYKFLENMFGKVSKKDLATRPRDIASVKELFDNLYQASEKPELLQNMQPSTDNMMFTQLNRSKAIVSVKDVVAKYEPFDSAESLKVVSYLDSMIPEIFNAVNEQKNTSSSPVRVLQTNGNRKHLYKVLENKIAERIEALKTDFAKKASEGLEINTQDLNQLPFLAKLLDNFGDITSSVEGKDQKGAIAFHMQNSRFKILANTFVELEEDPTDIEQSRIVRLDGGNIFSSREAASQETKTILSSIYKIDRNKTKVGVDDNGKPTLSVQYEIDPETGLYVLLDEKEMWSKVAKVLAGSFDKTEMYKRLSEGVMDNPEFLQLLSYLPNPEDADYKDKAEFDIETKFWQDLKKPRLSYVQLNLNITKSATDVISEARVQRTDFDRSKVLKDWEINFLTVAQSEFIVENEAGQRVLDLDKLVKYYKNNLKPSNVLEFLNALGIVMDTSNPTIASVVEDPNFMNKFAIGQIYDSLEQISKTYDKEKFKFLRNPLSYLKSSLPKTLDPGSKFDSSSRIKELANIQVRFSDKYSNFSAISPEGNRVWEHFLDNTFTRIMTSLNHAKSWQELTNPDADPNGLFRHMRYLAYDNNTYTRHSVLLKSLFNSLLDVNNPGGKKDNRLVIQNVAGTQLIDKKSNKSTGVSTASMDATSKYLQEIHTMLMNGVEEFMRHASKQMSQGIVLQKGIRTYDGKKSTNLYVDLEKFLPTSTDGERYAFNILAGYLSGEVNRIFKFSSDLKKYEQFTGYTRSVERKTGKVVMAGQALAAFEDVLSKETQEKIYKIVDSAVKNKETDFDFSDIYENNPTLTVEIKKDVAKYFGHITDELKNRLDQTKFIDPTLRARVDNKGVELTPDESDRTLLKAYAYNSWIHKFETAILGYGDFAQYNHSKEEFHKRNAGFGSGGLGFASDLKTRSFVNKMTKLFDKKAPRKPYDGTLTTAIIKEREIEKSVYYDEYYDALVKEYTKRFGDKAKAEELAETALKEYKGMKIGDGQGHISFESYRMLKNLEGNWLPEQEELYKKLANGEDVSTEDIVHYFPPYKLQYCGPMETTGLPLTSFHKFSLAPIVPGVAKKGTPLYNLHQKMMLNDIDYVLFESGSKVGHLGKGDEVYDKDGNILMNAPFTKNIVFTDFLKNQTEVNSEYKGKSIFSTQMRKLILDNLYENGAINSPNEEDVVSPLVKRYLNNVSDYTELVKLELLEEIGFDETSTGEYVPRDKESIGKLLSLVRNNLDREESYSDEMLNFIDALDSGQLLHDLSLHPEALKIEKLLLSLINKRVIKQKVKGEPLVQVSSAFYENNLTESPKFRNATEADKKKWVGSNLLPTYHKMTDGKTAAMKVMIALQGDYANLLNLDYNGQTIETLDRLNQAIKDDEWLDANNGANRKAITLVGVRIPVQGLNSMEFMEVYEFLPAQAGNIIIPPAEIVAKSGGDFDIDKLTIFMTNIDQEGKLKSRLFNNTTELKSQLATIKGDKEQSITKVFKQQKAGVENDLMNDIKEILELPQNFGSLVTPNGTFLLKDIADDLATDVMEYNPFKNYMTAETREPKKNKKIISATRVLEPLYNLYKHESNIVGKKTLGLGAVENTMNVLLNSIGALMPKTYTNYKGISRDTSLGLRHNTREFNNEKRISLSNLYDVDNTNKIADVFSQAMNGWVDVEKDAWIFFIQGNYEVAPTLLYLIKAGVPVKEAIYFVSQPLVREYVDEQRLAKSTFGDVLGKTPENKALVKYQAASTIINKYFDANVVPAKGTSEERFRAATNLFNKFMADRKDKVFTEKEMRDLIRDSKRTPSEKMSDLSLTMFMHYLDIEDQIKGITQIKMNANPDTNIKSVISDIETSEGRLENLENNPELQPIISALMSDSVISSFFNNKLALSLAAPLFKLRYNSAIRKFIKGKDDAGDLLQAVISTFGEAGRDNYLNTFRNDLVTYIFQNTLVKTDIKKGYMSYDTKELPAKQMVSDNFGAFVKTNTDGSKTLFYNLENLEKEYLSEKWKNTSQKPNYYSSLGLHPLPANTFTIAKGQNSKAYARFVMEREYLRSVYPIAETGLDKANYEEFLANRALDNTFNVNHLFSDPKNAFAIRLYDIILTNPKLVNKFDILSKLQLDNNTENTMFNLELVDRDIDNIKANIYTKNLSDLANPVLLKSLATELSLSDQEIENITDIFSRLPLFAYLQSGINKTKANLVPYVSTKPFLDIMDDAVKDFTGLLADSGKAERVLQDFYDKFNTQNSYDNKDKNRFKNYFTDINFDKIESKAVTPKVQTPTEGKKKELFTFEKGMEKKSFRGKPLSFVDKIPTAKDTVVAMRNNRTTGLITIDAKAMAQKFIDKAWTKPAKQLDDSYAKPLSENEFKSANEFFTFALIHEVKHDTIFKQEGENTGAYEDRINQAALEDLRKNYNTQPQAEAEVETQYLITTNESNVFIFDDSKTKTADYYRQLTSANSTVGFVYNASKQEIEKNLTLPEQSLLRFVSPDTALPFITSLDTNSDNFSTLASENYQSIKNYFDRKIQELKNAKDSGFKIALPIEGIGNVNKMPEELFVYLSKRLFEELGYLNPGSTMYQDIKEILSNKQGISDDEILASLGFESDPFNCV